MGIKFLSDGGGFDPGNFDKFQLFETGYQVASDSTYETLFETTKQGFLNEIFVLTNGAYGNIRVTIDGVVTFLGRTDAQDTPTGLISKKNILINSSGQLSYARTAPNATLPATPSLVRLDDTFQVVAEYPYTAGAQYTYCFISEPIPFKTLKIEYQHQSPVFESGFYIDGMVKK